MTRDECLARVAELERELAEARAMLEWPEREDPPTPAEVKAGHTWWMAERRPHPDDEPLRIWDQFPFAPASLPWFPMSNYRCWRRCTPDGKPALLPEVKG